MNVFNVLRYIYTLNGITCGHALCVLLFESLIRLDYSDLYTTLLLAVSCIDCNPLKLALAGFSTGFWLHSPIRWTAQCTASPQHVEMMVITVTNRQQDGLRKQVSSQPINHGNTPKSAPWIILFVFAKTAFVLPLITCQEISETVPWNPAPTSTGGSSCQPAYRSEVTLVRDLRSGLVVLINIWDPRFVPRGNLVTRGLTVLCPLISEINIHIIIIPCYFPDSKCADTDMKCYARPEEGSREQDISCFYFYLA